ncbi:MAG: PAS domain-containing sensor histidine kinase [Candidatus Tectimicrobiota bacterium]
MLMNSTYPVVAPPSEALAVAPVSPLALVQALPLGVCLVDASGRIVSLNTAGEHLLGWGATACRGMVWHDLIGCSAPSPDGTATECPTALVLRTHRPVWLPCTMFQCRDGTTVPVEYTCMPLTAQAGTSAVVSFRDLRRQIQMERDLQRLASVPEESPLPIVELDRAAHVTYANTAMLTLLEQCGFTAQALPAILPSALVSLIQACLQDGRSRQGLPGTAAGRYFEWTFCPLPQAGVVRGYGVDLTERKHAEQILQASRDALLEAWRLKSEFVANISHELRTPLNGIIGMTQLVLESALDSEQRNDLRMVEEAAHHLLGLVTNLLDFAELESGQLRLVIAPFDVRAVLTGLLPFMQQQAQQKGLDFCLEIAPTVPATVQGDAERLQKILVSLVRNAIKFTSQGTILIRVAATSCSTEQVTLHWTVQDTGIGVPEEQQQFIFEAFRQGDGSSTRVYGGIGLGLTIAAQLVAIMGGEIWLESAGPGLGSAVHFTTCFGVPPEAVLQSLPEVAEG